MAMFHVVLTKYLPREKKVLNCLKCDFPEDLVHSRAGNGLNMNDMGANLTSVFHLYLMPVYFYHKTGKEL